MKRLPDLLFIVDVCREDAAVHEANLLKIPIVSLVDTNCNPQGIDYVIPSNDDAIRAIKLLVAKIADAVLEGKAMRKDEEAAEAAVETSASEAAPRAARRAGREAVSEQDEEVGEEALLGESTLAKLNVTRKPAEAEAAPAEAAPVEPAPAAPETEAADAATDTAPDAEAGQEKAAE